MKPAAPPPAALAAGPRYFATPAELRDWFARHAAHEAELVVGYHKRDTGVPSITWPESVDEALCVGWIDSVRRRIDEARYQIRFTPRRPGSTWSAVNIARVQALIAQGRMQPAGLAAFALRLAHKSGTYSYEQQQAAVLAPADEAAFRRQRAAWAFFQAQPAAWRQQMIWRIVSARQAATRARRLATLIEACRAGRRLD